MGRRSAVRVCRPAASSARRCHRFSRGLGRPARTTGPTGRPLVCVEMKGDMDVSGFRRVPIACAVAVATALGVCGLASTAVLAATITPVATGLDNPRGLSFGPDGRLYVAEAGNAGTACNPPEHPE